MSKNQSLKEYLFEIVRKYKIYLVCLFCLSVGAAFFETFMRYQIKEIIDFVGESRVGGLYVLLGTYVSFKFLHHFLFFCSRLLDIRYKPKLITKLSSDIYQKTSLHSLAWFEGKLSGEISGKINDFQVNITHLITGIFKTLVIFWGIIVGMVFIFYLNIWAALVQLAFLSIYVLVISYLLRKQIVLQENYVQANQETLGIINDSISNIFSIKIIGNMATEFKQKLFPSLKRREKLDKVTRKFDAFWVDNCDTALSMIVSISQIVLLATLFQKGIISAGSFVFIIMITLKMNKEIDEFLDRLLFEINPQIAAIRSSYNFINEKYDIEDKKDAKNKLLAKGKIDFENVDFSYGKYDIFKNFNLSIARGEKVAIVGHSGAGKTSLIKILLRYFDPQKGSVKIDDIKLEDLSQEVLRENISLIPQDISLFHRSIRENLQFANYKASKEQIIEACKEAQIHQDIMQMSDAYDTIVGERGVKISGGQRQRIAIARAILKDAPILILDEATSSLDSYNEKLIQKSLNILIEGKKKTVIAIAHRLSTIKHMDRIIVLEKGKIVQMGKHQELLLEKDSFYKKLWELQTI